MLATLARMSESSLIQNNPSRQHASLKPTNSRLRIAWRERKQDKGLLRTSRNLSFDDNASQPTNSSVSTRQPSRRRLPKLPNPLNLPPKLPDPRIGLIDVRLR